MKKIQPAQKYTIIALVALAMLSAFLFLCLKDRVVIEKFRGAPIEPFITGRDDELSGIPHVQDSEVIIFDISADRLGNNIVFGSDNNKVTLLDREGKLKWERTIGSFPLQTLISSCGGYIAIGTSGGRLLFLSDTQEVIWEKDLEKPVYHLAISGNRLLAGCGDEEALYHDLYLFDLDGNERWKIETGVLEDIQVYSMEIGGAENDTGPGGDRAIREILSIENSSGLPRVVSRDFDGEEKWVIEGAGGGKISLQAGILAVFQEDSLVVYNLRGDEIWREKLEIEPTSILINPANRRVLAYCEFSGGADNLYYFSSSGLLLWNTRVDDGSLVSFSLQGHNIICSSWRQYKDNSSKIVIFNEDGTEINSFDVTVQVEKMFTIDANNLFLAGRDGRIYKVNPSVFREEADFQVRPRYYVPVLWGNELEETMITLYFYDREANHLIPISRRTKEISLSLAIDELIRGPVRGSELLRTIPKDSVIDVTYDREAGAVYLDLEPGLARISGSTQSLGIINSLLYTVSRFLRVEHIFFTVDGDQVETFGEGISLDYPVKKSMIFDPAETPVIIPYRSGERFYLLPLRELREDFSDLKELLQWLINSCPYFFPRDLEVTDVSTQNNVTRVFFNQAFTSMFPAESGEREEARAAVVLDALFLTVAENVESRTIYFVVQDKLWSPPQGYPSLFKEINRPYFINPER